MKKNRGTAVLIIATLFKTAGVADAKIVTAQKPLTYAVKTSDYNTLKQFHIGTIPLLSSSWFTIKCQVKDQQDWNNKCQSIQLSFSYQRGGQKVGSDVELSTFCQFKQFTVPRTTTVTMPIFSDEPQQVPIFITPVAPLTKGEAVTVSCQANPMS